jgi:hypothetical protein
MIFGELLTGSNFDDTAERTTGGRNPLLCLIIKEYSSNLFFNEYLRENSIISYYGCIGFYTRFYSKHIIILC